MTGAELAVVTDISASGEQLILSSQRGPGQELLRRAEELNARLRKEVAALEESLVKKGILPEIVPADDVRPPRGDAETWHAVGLGLRKLADENGFTDRPRERRWLWRAIYNLHATNRIRRVTRGRNRDHFEYCFRLARFPAHDVDRMKWSEWVTFFDSTTARGDERIDEWLQAVLEGNSRVSRRLIRTFFLQLNLALRELDTSVLEKGELFALYDKAWADPAQSDFQRPERRPRADTVRRKGADDLFGGHSA